MIKVYIAGASREIERAEKWIRHVKGVKGLEVTCDWPAAMRAAGADVDLCEDDRRRYARADWEGVERADVLWLLRPTVESTGAWVELGIALAGKTRVIVSGKGRFCIFDSLANVRRFEYDADAYAFLREYARTKTPPTLAEEMLEVLGKINSAEEYQVFRDSVRKRWRDLTAIEKSKVSGAMAALAKRIL